MALFFHPTQRPQPRRWHGYVVWFFVGLLWSLPAWSCSDTVDLTLKYPVHIDDATLEEFSHMPPLRVVTVDAPPMVSYNKKSKTYTGISVDLLCFIADKLGIDVEYVDTGSRSVAEKIQMVQENEADLFMPLSLQPDRESLGQFTQSYFDNYYAVIGLEHAGITISNLTELRDHRVGIVQGVSFSHMLKALIPSENLYEYDQSMGANSLFDALRSGRVDVAVYNKSIFTEKRYKHDLFDMVVLDTLYEYPRAYRFYLSNGPQHHNIIQAFNTYLEAINTSKLIAQHQDGEQQFIERYVSQRSQRILTQAGGIIALVFALVFYFATRRYRRLSRLLERRNEHIQLQRSALQKANLELEALSQRDELTRLANRRHFNQTLEHEHSRWARTGAPLSLLLMDVDHFKRVNDRFGHLTGDEYLCAIARVLQESVTRPADVVARYGGEEFACLLPHTSPQQAQHVARRILSRIRALDLPNPDADTPYLTISIGVATLVNGQYSSQDLVWHADKQLYTVKETGRNGIRAIVCTQDQDPDSGVTVTTTLPVASPDSR